MRVGPLWWVLFAVLMAWNVYSFFPRHATEVALPYSEFLTQLAAGNVASTRIVGASISGTLKRALHWPAAQVPATPARSATPAASGASAPATPARRPARAAAPQPASADYTKFRTDLSQRDRRPDADGALRAQHVTLDVAEPSTPWFAFLLTDGLPILLMFGLLVWMGRQASRNQSGIFGFARTRARRYTRGSPQGDLRRRGGRR